MAMTHDMPVALVQHILPISLWGQQGMEVGVTIVAAAVVTVSALAYFRRVQMERPPIGKFNGRDIFILMCFIVALPFLYAALPEWALTCFLVLTFASSLSIGYRPVVRPAVLWLGIGLLIGANIFTARTLEGTTIGWQLWWAELDILVGLGSVSVANLYVQGGMKLRYVAWFALALGVYDIIFATAIPLTDKLTEEFLGAPLDPSFGMRFGIYNASIGIGDLLVFALFAVAAYKAYGRQAARIALGMILVFGVIVPNLAPIFFNFIDTRHDVLVPGQTFFGPAAFLCYLWLKHKYGRERTMVEYRASLEGAPQTTTATQPAAPAPEPASA
jgi:hypothetical protein